MAEQSGERRVTAEVGAELISLMVPDVDPELVQLMLSRAARSAAGGRADHRGPPGRGRQTPGRTTPGTCGTACSHPRRRHRPRPALSNPRAEPGNPVGRRRQPASTDTVTGRVPVGARPERDTRPWTDHPRPARRHRIPDRPDRRQARPRCLQVHHGRQRCHPQRTFPKRPEAHPARQPWPHPARARLGST